MGELTNRLLSYDIKPREFAVMSLRLAMEIAEEYMRITGIEVSVAFMPNGPDHSPTSLQAGMCGVYAFLAGDCCVKVGKAGPKSKARWNSHHYNLDETTPSAMTKSIIKNRGQFKKCYPDTKHREIDRLDKQNIQQWIKSNMDRMEFLMKYQGDGIALNLLEALVQYRLKPIFEGRLA